MALRNYILPIFILSGVYGCSNQPAANMALGKPIYIGERINEEGAIDCSELKEKLGDAAEMDAKVKGEVIGICPDKSCELKMDMEDGTCLVVKMNNMAVSIPRDATGKTAIIEGRAYVDTTSTKLLPGYKMDSGLSASESEVTSDPEVSLAFNAKGVIIR
jgi:hypothetical protein